MRILLVDDEIRVLEGLERLLYSHDEWEIMTASSGEQGLEIMDQFPIDLLVTDMRMPGMDGAELMTLTRERHPEVVRVVLSGHTEDIASMRAARVAHQFLDKPCDARSFIAVIERTVLLRRYLDDDNVRKALGRVESLPSVPRLYCELSAALDADRPADDLAGIIRQDPALAAKLLQLVNSSFFVRGSSISDVATAVMRLGVRIVRDLTMVVEVFGRARGKVPPCISIEKLQLRSLRTAQLAQKLVQPSQVAATFMAGLLRDVGLLALAEISPKMICELYASGCPRRCPVEPAAPPARDCHGDIGAYILGAWGLPLDVIDGVANHDAPERIGGTSMTVSSAVYIACALVDDKSPDAALLARTGLTSELPRWIELARKTPS
jgi:HD-like signal output (HDOD) protein/CheY-like chemotaxis protein